MKANTRAKKIIAGALIALLMTGLCACAGQADDSVTEADNSAAATEYLTKEDITVNETFTDDSDGGHAIEVSGEEAEYANTGVTKTGEADGDEADFYGENSAVFATEKGTLTIKDSLIETNGTHANAVFSYGEGTTVSIADSVIETQGNCSGGLMTTGGGTMNAEVIYSTADITVNDAYMESTASQGVVVEGKNSVTLNNDTLVADNNQKNSDKSEYYQAVMIYQSMSGDAAEGTSSFTANGGSITNKNGDIFFVNNTATEISLSGVEITNEDAGGVFLRAEAAGWGSEGSNGGKVNMNASGQTINGDMLVDDISTLNLYLKDKSAFSGSINPDGQSGDVYVEIEDGSTWTLTADSYISGLTVNEGSAIDLNGYKLYVDGKEYSAGSSSTGEAFDISTGSGSGSGAPDGMPGGNGPGGEPPEKPDGEGGPGGQGGPGGNPPSGNGGEPPEKPDGNN